MSEDLGYNILLVDDNESLLGSLERFFVRKNICTVRSSVDADGCLEHINESGPPDVAIVDIGLPSREGKDGIWLIEQLRALHPDLPVVVLSAYNIDIGVKAMRVGAWGFAQKPIVLEYLWEIIRRATEFGRLARENRQYKAANFNEQTEFVRASVASRKLWDCLEHQANKNCRVMLLGAIGTGKQHCARVLHEKSEQRRDKPFVVANCQSPCEDLLEEQLFGKSSKDGYHILGLLEQAQGGTIYFNEVCSLPAAIQSKLVRALVRNRYERKGGGVVWGLDCRVVSGTSHDISRYVEDKLFSRDLFDRLNVVSITIPPLNMRRDDIPELTQHFADCFLKQHGLPNRAFSSDAINVLKTMNWSSSAVELRGFVERLVLSGDPSKPITADDIRRKTSGSNAGSRQTGAEKYLKMKLREARNEFERQYLISQINLCGGNISDAAKNIGMERSALHRKLKGLEVETKSLVSRRVM